MTQARQQRPERSALLHDRPSATESAGVLLAADPPVAVVVAAWM